jgi:hypothetical protein
MLHQRTLHKLVPCRGYKILTFMQVNKIQNHKSGLGPGRVYSSKKTFEQEKIHQNFGEFEYEQFFQNFNLT